MKATFTNSFFVFALSVSALCLLMSSCKKSDGSSAAASNTATVTIGKTSLNAVTSTSGAVDANNVFSLEYAQVTTTDTILFAFNFPDTLVLNKPYAVDGNYISFSYLDVNKTGELDYETYLNTNSGTITVTSLNKTTHVVSGTFTGTEIYNVSTPGDSLLISNGKFNATYSE